MSRQLGVQKVMCWQFGTRKMKEEEETLVIVKRIIAIARRTKFVLGNKRSQFENHAKLQSTVFFHSFQEDVINIILLRKLGARPVFLNL